MTTTITPSPSSSLETEPSRSGRRPARLLWLLAFVAGAALASGGFLFDQRRQQQAALALEASKPKVPDWSGLWVVDRSDPKNPWGKGEPSWTPAAAKQIEDLRAVEKSGVPKNVFIDCLPEGMPTYVIMTLNAFEFLFTPGRVTILGEFDGNRTRRIYTDGRPHPQDPDLTFNGHSIGHWEGDVLVVDTVAVLPQTFLALGQAVALPNNGDMHIVEHIRPIGPDSLRFELEIDAPHMLTKPWLVTRTFNRLPDRKAEIVEASCRQGDFAAAKDDKGNDIFVPIPHDQGGAPLPFDK